MPARALVRAGLVLCLALATADAVGLGRRARERALAAARRNAKPGLPCKELWFEQVVDHFGWGPTPSNVTTWRQRYFLCDPTPKDKSSPGGDRPIFFYTGNEGDVELYLHSNGLMWENAPQFGAYLVFAEHRYYGKSWPMGTEVASMRHLRFLTHEQALADYARLISSLKKRLGLEDSAVISFGGSYGGMLSAWFRQKYPHIIVGAIAASAPLIAFDGLSSPYDSSTYWASVSQDFSTEGGCPAACAQNIRASWEPLFTLGESAAGRNELTQAFRMCTPLGSVEDVNALALFVAMGLDTLAMGNFPYPSTYLSEDPLPAWPVRAACAKMAGGGGDAASLLAGLREAIGVLYNASGTVPCFELPEDDTYDGVWDYQWCTELLPQESYFTRNGVSDIFYPFTYTDAEVDAHCMKKYGVTPRRGWIADLYGGAEGLAMTSNVVLSNGGFDPWSSGGILKSLSPSVITVWIPEGAHHLDLFFSNKADPPAVVQARKFELKAIKSWLDAHAATLPQKRGGGVGGVVA